MKAAVFTGGGRLELRDVVEPSVSAVDDVIIEVEVAGMCGTDAHIVAVPQLHPATEGIILGHELVGRVVDTGGSVSGLARGDRVVAAPNIWCGQCEACRRGERRHCGDVRTLGISIDGAFARYVKAPARVVVPVPLGLDPEAAVFAEPVSCCINGMRRLGSVIGESVVVFGAGPIGQYFIRLLRLAGAREVVAVEPATHRREAAVASGAHQVADPGAWHPSGSHDVSIDTVGSLLPIALGSIRPGGRVLVFGMDATATCAVSPYDLVRNQKAVLGCFVDNECLPASLELLPALGVPNLVTHRLDLDHITEGIAAVADGTALKVLVSPGQ